MDRELISRRGRGPCGGAHPSISLFLPSLDGGGAERITVTLAGEFLARSLRVDLVLAVAQGPYLAHVPRGVRVVNLQARSAPARLVSLSRYLRRERPAGLISACDNINIATCAKRLARVPTPIILGVHTHLSRDLAGRSGFTGCLRRWLVRLVYPWADAIVAVSHGVAADLAAIVRLPPGLLHVIYNPVVTPALADKAKEAVEHPWLAPSEPPVVLAVGRLTKEKDFATLLRAFARVRSQRVVRLICLGDGEERPMLEALSRTLGVAPDVDFCGFVANPYAWMARAAMLVLSSRREGLPTVLIEALALGTPVVATDCDSGPREILEDGRFGTLVPVGDVERLAAALLETLCVSPERAALQTRSLAFSAQGAAERYLNLLRATTARGRSSRGADGPPDRHR